MSYLEKLNILNFLFEPYEMYVEECPRQWARLRLKNASSEVHAIDINHYKCFDNWTHIDKIIKNLSFIFRFRTWNYEYFRTDNIYFRCQNIEEMCMKRDLLVNERKL